MKILSRLKRFKFIPVLLISWAICIYLWFNFYNIQFLAVKYIYKLSPEAILVDEIASTAQGVVFFLLLVLTISNIARFTRANRAESDNKKLRFSLILATCLVIILYSYSCLRMTIVTSDAIYFKFTDKLYKSETISLKSITRVDFNIEVIALYRKSGKSSQRYDGCDYKFKIGINYEKDWGNTAKVFNTRLDDKGSVFNFHRIIKDKEIPYFVDITNYDARCNKLLQFKQEIENIMAVKFDN
jgi:hypothetical protein